MAKRKNKNSATRREALISAAIYQREYKRLATAFAVAVRAVNGIASGAIPIESAVTACTDAIGVLDDLLDPNKNGDVVEGQLVSSEPVAENVAPADVENVGYVETSTQEPAAASAV